MRHLIIALGRCRRGVVAVEFALVSVPLMILIFGFIACSMVFFCLASMQNNAQYAALMVATGQITSNNNGAITTSNTTATTTCRSTMVSTQAEYYACTGLPSWASFTVTTTETCSVPSVTVTLSANASSAALTDTYQIFSGKTVSATVVMMKQGTCP